MSGRDGKEGAVDDAVEVVVVGATVFVMAEAAGLLAGDVDSAVPVIHHVSRHKTTRESAPDKRRRSGRTYHQRQPSPTV